MFKTKRPDGKSYRELAVEALKDEPIGSVIPYVKLMDRLDVDDRRKVNAIVRSAIKSLLKLYNRGVKCVPSVGYRVLRANEHMLAAGGHQSKADRAMSRALNFYQGTDLGQMTEVERKLHSNQHMLAQAIMASHKHLDKRIDRIEALLKGGETIKAD